MNKKLMSGLLACCLAGSMMTSAFALEPADGARGSISGDGEQIWFVELDPDFSVDAEVDEAVKASYKIRVHYENANGGSEYVETISDKAPVGSALPWAAEAKYSREYKNKNYVMSGVVAKQVMSEKAADNIADIYYRLDVDKTGAPDKLEKSNGKADYEITYVYADPELDEIITHVKTLRDVKYGERVLDSVMTTVVYGENDMTYALSEVSAKSLYVSADKNLNKLTVKYVAMPELDEDGNRVDAEVDENDEKYPDVCPFNGQPGWICIGTHDHEAMKKAQEAEQKSVQASEVEVQVDESTSWCAEHDQPSWVCVGKH